MNILQSKGQRFDGTTGTVASGSASITEAASTGRVHYTTDISASSPNSTCLVELLDGSTVMWRSTIGSGGYINHAFVTPLAATTSTAVRLQAGTAHAVNLNLAGFTI